MNILQIADLHITGEVSLSTIKPKLDKLHLAISDKIIDDEKLLLVICGDVVDKGNAKDNLLHLKLKIAKEIIDYISKLFSDVKLQIDFVPGNHDLQCESFSKFNELIQNYNNREYYYNNDNTGILRKYDNYNVLLLNSTFHKNINYGKIDLKCIEKLDDSKPTIIVIHHTFLSENDDDSSSVRNAYKFFELLKNKNIIALLHGHTHGYKDIKVGNKFNLVGVGPFLKPITDVNNQFNFIELNGSVIEKITNYRYSSDLDKFSPEVVFTQNNTRFFFGDSVKKVYDAVLNETCRFKCIYNIDINVVAKYDNFEREILGDFSESLIAAKDWQERFIPENLYYNHGTYMKYEDVWGLDYVVKELKAKATSSRAIIPLINFADVSKSKDNFLPSLDIIQVGFNEESKTKLLLTIYMRALEVNHFLKINLCELFLIIKKIKDEIRSIDMVEINVFAFRAQYKEKYGCFKKAEIDQLSESKLLSLIYNGNYECIINLLIEKLDLSETVIQDTGIERLKSAISTAVDEKKCSKELLDYNKKVIEKLYKLKIEREKTSNYDQIEVLENELTRAISEFIDILRNERRREG